MTEQARAPRRRTRKSPAAADKAPPSPRPRRRQRDYDDRRDHILAGARRLFFLNAFEQVSIRDIERDTGYTRGAIYYYFASKEEVYLAVVADGLALVRSTLELAIGRSRGDSTAKVRAVVRAFARHFEQARPVFDILIRYFFGMRPGHLLPEEALAVIDREIAACVDLVAGVVEEGVRRGELRCGDPRFEVMTMWGMLTTVIQMRDDNPRMRSVGRSPAELLRGLEAHIVASLGGGT